MKIARLGVALVPSKQRVEHAEVLMKKLRAGLGGALIRTRVARRVRDEKKPGTPQLRRGGCAGAFGLIYLVSLTSAACGGGGGASPTAPTEVPTPSLATVTCSAEVGDPAGDSGYPWNHHYNIPDDAIRPDLRLVTARTVAGSVELTARIEPGSFDFPTSVIQFELDTDQNESTGSNWELIGADYMVTFYRGSAAISRANSDNSTTNVSTGPSVETRGDVLVASVSLSDLGGDDGRLTFRATARVRPVGSNITSAPVDMAPDYGIPGASCR